MLQTPQDNKKAYSDLCVVSDNDALCVRHFRRGRVCHSCSMPRHPSIHRCVARASNYWDPACTLQHMFEIGFWTSQCGRRNEFKRGLMLNVECPPTHLHFDYRCQHKQLCATRASLRLISWKLIRLFPSPTRGEHFKIIVNIWLIHVMNNIMWALLVHMTNCSSIWLELYVPENPIQWIQVT